MIIAGSVGMVAYTVGWSILPDCVEVDERETGKRREGLYFSILSLVHYEAAAAVQSSGALLGIKSIYCLGSILFILISFVFVIKYPLSREKHAAILEALEQRRNGEEYSTEKFEDLL